MISVVGFSYVPYISEERRDAQSVAIRSLLRYPNIIPVALDFKGTKESEELKSLGIRKLNLLERNSRKELGNSRDLPYIKEIFDILSKIKCDNIGYANSDIMFTEKTSKVLGIDFESYLFSRVDVTLDINEHTRNKLVLNHSGMDSWFFNKFWWVNHNRLFPNDLVLGESEVDTCYRHIAKKNSFYVETRDVLHIKHESQWNLKSKGAINNIQIWEDVKRRFK